MYSFLRQTTVALRALLVLTPVLGVLYPALLLGIGRAVPARADGSPLTVDGRVAGSRLLAQESTGRAWFHPRPSAPGLDGSASGGSNLGPNEPDQVAAIAERYHDDKGLAWPRAVAPADVHVVVATKGEDGLAAAETLAAGLEAEGLTVLVDDRPKVSPGVKFKDAELIGVPTTGVFGRGLEDGELELKDRATGEARPVPVDGAVAAVLAEVRDGR